MLIYPAIDIRGGRCVRLYQGDFAAETVYDDHPADVARRFEEAGALRLHVVDLDAARIGVLVNIESVAAIASGVAIPVQYGGGVRSAAAARALVEAGAARLVVGTAALERPDLLAEIHEIAPVALSLDVRGREVALRGWQTGSGRSIGEVLADLSLRGEASRPEALVVTQISRDGTLDGPDCDLLAEALAATDIPLIASGGVGGVEDVGALAELGVGDRRLEGAIVGRALYEGRVGLAELLALAGQR